MKIFATIALALALANTYVAFGQQLPPQPPPPPTINMGPGLGAKAQITFKEASHDFGTIKQGEKLEYVFTYANTGESPLVISNIQTTCGCTASKWAKTPVMPGKTGQVTVSYNSAGKVGKQNKVITVYSNSINSEERLMIITNVLPPDSASKN